MRSMYRLPEIYGTYSRLYGVLVETIKLITLMHNRKFSLEELQAKFGQSHGIWLYDICRGIDTSEGKGKHTQLIHGDLTLTPRPTVTKVKVAKSMMASKVFSPPLRLHADVERWMAVLGSEIYMRMMDEFEERSRWAKTLVVRRSSLYNDLCENAI